MSICLHWCDRLVVDVPDWQQWNLLVKYYKSNGPQIVDSKTRLLSWVRPNSWNVCRDGYGNYWLYVGNDQRDRSGDFRRYLLKQPTSTKVGLSGTKCRAWLARRFLDRTKRSLRVAFGAVNRLEFLGFQYTPIVYFDYHFQGRTLSNIYKADVSSAYPFQGSKSLPDSHKGQRIQGRVPPSEEFPFAYYLKSNQLAIWNEFDTRDWKDHFLSKNFIDFNQFRRDTKSKYKDDFEDRFHYIDVPDTEEITLLMRKSSENLAPEFEFLYRRRNQNPEYKDIMVRFIGAMSSNNAKVTDNTYQRHITSVIYARHMVRMMQLYDKIVSEGGVVISVATDSIIWTSRKEIPIAVSSVQKRLGSFTWVDNDDGIEARAAKAYFKAHGVYAIEKDGNIIDFVHQSYKITEEDLQELKSGRVRCWEIEKFLRRGDSKKVFFDPVSFTFFEEEFYI